MRRLVAPSVVITATACTSVTTMATTLFLSNFFTVAHDVGSQDTVRPVLLGQHSLKVAARLLRLLTFPQFFHVLYCRLLSSDLSLTLRSELTTAKS